MQTPRRNRAPIPRRIPNFSALVYFAISPFRVVALPLPNQRRLAVAVLCRVRRPSRAIAKTRKRERRPEMQTPRRKRASISRRIRCLSALVRFAISPFRAVALLLPNQRRLAVAVLCRVRRTSRAIAKTRKRERRREMQTPRQNRTPSPDGSPTSPRWSVSRFRPFALPLPNQRCVAAGLDKMALSSRVSICYDSRPWWTAVFEPSGERRHGRFGGRICWHGFDCAELI
jgi:hypothetical protein